MSSKFLIVVVIYECSFDGSVTIQRLLSFQAKSKFLPEILIYDNSLKSQLSDKYLQSIPFYYHDAANRGVAAAYNYALSLAKTLQKEWLVLFDQDTEISNNYFEQLKKSIECFPQQKLFCPIVQSGDTIVSPTYYLLEKPIKPRKLMAGLFNSSCYTIINSGLTIQLKELEALGGYDSDLPLDLSDHNFFRKYKKKNKKFVLINTVNSHNLSSESDTSFETVYSRFQKYYNSASIYSNKIHSFLPMFWLLVRTIKLTFKFNRFEFIKFILFKK